MSQVLGDGEVLEFDTPANLRADPNSHLSLMMRQMENVETDTSVVQH